MQAVVRDTHIVATVLAKGGVEQMTQRDWGRVGATVREEYKHLRTLSISVEKGTVSLDGRFMRRAESYVEAGRNTFEWVYQDGVLQSGFTTVENILQPGSKTCQSCQEEADKGVVPIGEISLPGSDERDCGRWCNCYLRYGREDA